MYPDDGLLVVGGFVPTAIDDTNLREEAWSFALDQRAFGPRKLLVAFADADGTFRGLAYSDRTDPPELALGPCIAHLGRGAAAAIAFCDEEVVDGPIDLDVLQRRFAVASAVCAGAGVHLVDWIACDDDKCRSSRIALYGAEEWWSVPPGFEKPRNRRERRRRRRGRRR